MEMTQFNYYVWLLARQSVDVKSAECADRIRDAFDNAVRNGIVFG